MSKMRFEYSPVSPMKNNMRLFDTPGADAAYDRWLNPPDYHEICKCRACHDEGEHEDDVIQWIKWGCVLCAYELEETQKREALWK